MKVGFDGVLDVVADLSKDSENLFVGAFGMCGVREAPVVAIGLARKTGTSGVGIAANGDYGINRLVEELIEVLRMVLRDIDIDFFQDFDGFGMNKASRIRPSAVDFK